MEELVTAFTRFWKQEVLGISDQTDSVLRYI